MANKRPIALYSGAPRELASGDGLTADVVVRGGASNDALVPANTNVGRVLRQSSPTANDVAFVAVEVAQFRPYAAELTAAAPPQLVHVNGRPALAFDAGTAETAYWTFVWPPGAIGTLTFTGFYIMASATSNKVDFAVAIEAVTPGDALDLDATTSFASDNTITAPTVPGTAGYLGSFTATCSNNDSVAAGDLVRISLRRDATDGTNDTATGDAYFLGGALTNG